MTRKGSAWGTRFRAGSIALPIAIVLVSAVFAARSAQAQTFTVLYAFTGGADGASPWAGLIRDGAGNLYGTTPYGGASGYGTVFMLNKSGKETVLYSFAYSDGAWPYAGLIRDAAGNLYGVATGGGGSGYGTAFKVAKTGKETTLYTFSGADGATPFAGLVQDAAGNLYGTTSTGGASSVGTAFKLAKTGKETVLHSFTGTGGDGSYPEAGLVRDANGNLYGTTVSGGASVYGTVFELNKTGKETVLYSFSGGTDGGYPLYGYLVRDAAGNLYGTTELCGAWGVGTVFKLDKTGKETVLYSFTEGADGGYPLAGLVRDAKGNLYGTTESGGASDYGTVFKVDSTGKETVLHSFNGSTDGGSPYAGLLRDAKGNFYGTTSTGGASGYGTVFKLTP
jgi:uncharacterized repeat protein (TIGR03803 family)